MTFKEIKESIKTKTVGIAGAGGLGSNCAVALARIGIGKLIIADYDIVSNDNLSRQYFFLEQVGTKKVIALKENILKIDPQVEIEIHDLKLDPISIKNIFENCDVIVEAFDLAEMKNMIIETVQTKMEDLPLVIGLGMAGWGDTNNLRVQKMGNLYICGDGMTEISEQVPPIAPRVGIVANMQANVVLEILLNTIKE